MFWYFTLGPDTLHMSIVGKNTALILSIASVPKITEEWKVYTL